MICCGQERNSLYCPDCGSPIVDESPLGSLLLYLMKAKRKAEAQARGARQFAEQARKPDEPVHSRHASEIVKKEAFVRKWKTWADELRKIIATVFFISFLLNTEPVAQ